MGPLFAGARVVGAVLRVCGRYRAASFVGLGLAVVWFVVVTLGADRATAAGPFVVNPDRSADEPGPVLGSFLAGLDGRSVLDAVIVWGAVCWIVGALWYFRRSMRRGGVAVAAAAADHDWGAPAADLGVDDGGRLETVAAGLPVMPACVCPICRTPSGGA